jgi:hypothetical protein
VKEACHFPPIYVFILSVWIHARVDVYILYFGYNLVLHYFVAHWLWLWLLGKVALVHKMDANRVSLAGRPQ